MSKKLWLWFLFLAIGNLGCLIWNIVALAFDHNAWHATTAINIIVLWFLLPQIFNGYKQNIKTASLKVEKLIK